MSDQPQQRRWWAHRHPILTTILGVFASLVLIAVFSGGGSSPTPTATVTQTVTRATPTHVRTVNSRACVQSVKIAQQAFVLVGQAFGEAAKYPPLVPQAAQAAAAGNTGQIMAIASTEKTINDALTALAARLTRRRRGISPDSRSLLLIQARTDYGQPVKLPQAGTGGDVAPDATSGSPWITS